MGAMKEFLITIRNGGDEAVAAVQRMGDDWRAMLEQAASEIEAQRLTVAEREAVEDGIRCCEYMAAYKPMESRADLVASASTLRALLARSATSTREGTDG